MLFSGIPSNRTIGVVREGARRTTDWLVSDSLLPIVEHYGISVDDISNIFR